jgi:raffinose/stachyose/melibiose transport system substrate-binding protein
MSCSKPDIERRSTSRCAGVFGRRSAFAVRCSRFAFVLALAAFAAAEAPKRELTFWHIQTYKATREVVDGAVKRWEAANPEWQVNVVALGNDDLKEKLRQAAAAGTRFPDVFHTWGGEILRDYVKGGQAREVESLATETDHLHAAALPFCEVDGTLAAVPADLAAVVMWYNKDLFKEHGLEVPKTQKELLAACGKLREAGVCPIALGNKAKWPGAFFFIYLSLRTGGPEPFRSACEGKPGATFADATFVEAGRHIQEMVKANAFPEGFNGMAYEQARQLFFDGKAAMMLMGTWLPANCISEKPEFLDKMGCFPYPAVEGGRGSAKAVVGGVNAAYGISAACTDAEAAYGLVRELTSIESGKAWAATGRIPALKPGAVEDMFTSAASNEAYRILAEADRIQHYYDQALPPKLAFRHKETTQALFALSTTPEEAAAAMERERGGLARAKQKPERRTWPVVLVGLCVVFALVILLITRKKPGAAS